MNRLTLWQRLAVVFTALLLACFGATAWLQMQQHLRASQQTEQRLLLGLAAHIAAEARAMDQPGLDAGRLAALVRRLQVTNPGVELYVLDEHGNIEMRYPDSTPLQRHVVALQPVREFLQTMQAPILGDDPLSAEGRKVFSVAAFPRGAAAGYLYAVLQGTAYDMAMAAKTDADLYWTLGSVVMVAALGLVAGLAAFALVTRPLSVLTREVERLAYPRRPTDPVGAEHGGRDAIADPDRAAEPVGLSRIATGDLASADAGGAGGEGALPRRPRFSGRLVVGATRDEIAILRAAFDRLVTTNAHQWERLSRQDRQRRELVANISHDLRTPLASLHGYLELLLLKAQQLSTEERDRYLRTALSQSERVGRLAGELLDLARLEMGSVRPVMERFSIVDLTLDVIQKLALTAQARRQRITSLVAVDLPDVQADIGMIERVLTNLLDNALRHSPEEGTIEVRLGHAAQQVRVEVIDSGPGIAPERRADLFERPVDRPAQQERSGLGLAIVRQIMRLHGDDIRIEDSPGRGAAFSFGLRSAAP